MDNINTNLINLIASFKKTGQSDDVIFDVILMAQSHNKGQ